MVFSLFIYSLTQYLLRQAIKENGHFVLNQLKKTYPKSYREVDLFSLLEHPSALCPSHQSIYAVARCEPQSRTEAYHVLFWDSNDGYLWDNPA